MCCRPTMADEPQNRLSGGSVLAVARSLGIRNLDEALADKLAPDVEYYIREVIQDAAKFMRHAKRRTFLREDVNNALRAQRTDELLGYSACPPSSACDPVLFTQALISSARVKRAFLMRLGRCRPQGVLVGHKSEG